MTFWLRKIRILELAFLVRTMAVLFIKVSRKIEVAVCDLKSLGECGSGSKVSRGHKGKALNPQAEAAIERRPFMARRNMLHLNFGPRTHEGAPVRNISTELQLRRSVMARLLWESQFYED